MLIGQASGEYIFTDLSISGDDTSNNPLIQLYNAVTVSIAGDQTNIAAKMNINPYASTSNTINISAGTFTDDITQYEGYMAAGTMAVMNDGGCTVKTVESVKTPITEGLLKSAADSNGNYSVMRVKTKSYKASEKPSIKYTVTDQDTQKSATQEYIYDTVVTDANIVFSLVIENIPKAKNISITAAE